MNESDSNYALIMLSTVSLFGSKITVNKDKQTKLNTEVGANLFIGNLSHDVDEGMLKSTFERFGNITSCTVWTYILSLISDLGHARSRDVREQGIRLHQLRQLY